MPPVSSILISIVVAAIAWAVAYFAPAIPLAVVLLAATLATALLVSLSGRDAPQKNNNKAGDTPREEGQVKWFNVSKGFGFITKDDGEEIFVHFRSIRGEGHRSLRDGQRVSFVEAQTEKGPQAEDVVALQ